VVANEGMLQSLPSVQNVRESARLLLTRAMFRLGANDIDGAWTDLLACHRLAALVGKHPPTTITYLIAVALNSMAAAGDAALIGQGLTVEQATKCLADCEQLAQLGDLADVIDEGSRIEALHAGQNLTVIELDTNMVLRNTNRTFDKVAAAMRLKAPAMRLEALDEIDQEFKTRIANSRKSLRLIAGLVINARRTITQNTGDVLLNLSLPATIQAENAQTRARIRRDQVRIGFAMATFHAETGKYPKSLDELAPKYLSEIPLDPYTQKSFVYLPRDASFLIYSFGPNAKDDGGKMTTAINEDDIPFEVPPKVDE
jgi:hypothetical protein